MGFGPTPSSIFGMPVGGYSSMSSSFGATSSSSNSDMLEKMKTLESELEAERERRNTLESELEAEQERRNAFEGVLLSTFQDMFGRVPQRLANFISHPPPVSNLYFTILFLLILIANVSLYTTSCRLKSSAPSTPSCRC